MKKAAKALTLILTLALALTLAVPAAAATGSRAVKISYLGIKIILDGEEIIPLDGNGKCVEPFALSGTTYLPVRAVANALGMNVGWDSGTGTVILTTGGQRLKGSGKALSTHASKSVTVSYRNIKITLDGKMLTPTDGNGKSVEPFAISGTTYLPVRAISNALGIAVDWDAATSSVILGKKGPETHWNLTSSRGCNGSGQTVYSEEYTYIDGRPELLHTHKYSEPAGGFSYTYVYGYDADGNVISIDETVNTPDGITSNTKTKLDGNGNVTEENADGMITAYTYDKYGNTLTETTCCDGSTQTTSYDYTYYPDGKVKTSHCAYGGTDMTVTYTYNSHGDATQTHYVITGQGAADYSYIDEYTYNAAGDVLTHKSRDTVMCGECCEYEVYTYDARGNVLTYESSYIDADKVKTVTARETYTYDAAGRCITEDYGDTSYTNTYDKNGNRIRSDCSCGGYIVYTYQAYTK